MTDTGRFDRRSCPVGATNVTGAIKAGTYTTASIPAGGSVTVKLVVAVANSSANSASYLLKATKSSVPTDAVKAVVKAN